MLIALAPKMSQKLQESLNLNCFVSYFLWILVGLPSLMMADFLIFTRFLFHEPIGTESFHYVKLRGLLAEILNHLYFFGSSHFKGFGRVLKYFLDFFLAQQGVIGYKIVHLLLHHFMPGNFSPERQRALVLQPVSRSG